MMGLGQVGLVPLSWIGGVVAVALVWGGVWMLLSAIGIAPRRADGRTDESTSKLLGPDRTWQQPVFRAGSDPAEDVADVRAVRDRDEQR